MKKRDIILFGIVGILIVQGVLINKFMNSGQGARVEVYVENKLYNTYPLDKDQKINIKEKLINFLEYMMIRILREYIRL